MPGPDDDKQKSSLWWNSASQFVKALACDVNEFIESISNENSDVLEDVRQTSQTVARHVGNILSSDLVHDVRAKSTSLVDQLQEVLIHPSSKTHSSSNEICEKMPSCVATNGKRGLPAGASIDEHIQWLQSDSSTYLTDPNGSESKAIAKRFQRFCDHFAISDDEKATTLASSVTLETFYHELVPSHITEKDFWERYAFALNEALTAGAWRQELLQHRAGPTDDAHRDIELSWSAENDNVVGESPDTDDESNADGDEGDEPPTSTGSECGDDGVVAPSSDSHDDDWDNWS